MTQQRPQILIVDDDRKSRRAVAAVLADLDLDILEADTGEAALKQVLNHSLALILLDIRLPGIDGFETARAIRGRAASRDIPIIFLSGYEHADIQISRGYDLGAVDYMTKPVPLDSLRAKVQFSVKYHLELLKARENEKLRLASEELAKMVKSLKASNDQLDDFAYIASHDLKEPLRGMAINANFLLRENLDTKVEKRVLRIVDLCERMDGLITELLTYSQVGRQLSMAQSVDATEIVSKVITDLSEFVQDRNGRVTLETPLPVVALDPTQIEIIFRNLITNALKYNNASRKTVEIGYDAPPPTGENDALAGRFYVRDNGIGIDPAQEDKVFRIFGRLNRDEAFGTGTGSGMAFVKKIVQGAGGSISFENNPRDGVTFHFSLPVVKAVAQAAPKG